jgi:drug/metabolite transporter (DMT)-like permease
LSAAVDPPRRAGIGLTHGRAVGLMVLVALLWSMAGVVTRQVQGVGGFELTFWRSAVNALALVALLAAWRGPAAVLGTLRRGGAPLWISGLCWATMFTAFMVALSFTTVANVLVTMALAPLVTALLARVVLARPIPGRTWAAVAAAGLGIVWMQSQGLAVQGAESGRHLLGMAIAAAVPMAAAINWTLIAQLQARHAGETARDDLDMLCGVLLGAVLSALLTLPLAWPMAAGVREICWMALLGVFQLAVPCLLAVVAARRLAPPEVALLALLEVLFGVAWAWWGGGETPGPATLGGGALVLLALGVNEALALRSRR